MIPIDFIISNKSLVFSSLKNRNKLNSNNQFVCVVPQDDIFNELIKEGFNSNPNLENSVFCTLDQLIDLDSKRRKIMSLTQDLQNKKNTIARDIGAKKSKGEDATELFKEADYIKSELPRLENETDSINLQLKSLLLCIPNIPQDDVPIGFDETSNLEIKKHGTAKSFDFIPLSHDEIGSKNNEMDFETASNLSGSRFVILHGSLAKLERKLANFMLEHNSSRGYQETNVPLLVKPHAFYGTGQLPKFEGNFYEVEGGYYLIPTSEVSLTNMFADKIIDEPKLPIRLTAYTPCFRSEAGAAGKDTKGMIRQHQFTKVELVTISHPQNSEEEHQYMLQTAEQILQKLDLPYRVVKLCTGDMGGSAKKTYDIEVWLPSQNCYREISSVSNTGDYQARRMMARFKNSQNGKNDYVHTLNGSSLAVGRTLVAILENYQNKDGSFTIPEILR